MTTGLEAEISQVVDQRPKHTLQKQQHGFGRSVMDIKLLTRYRGGSGDVVSKCNGAGDGKPCLLCASFVVQGRSTRSCHVRLAGGQNGFETWRFLVRRYDPRNKTKGQARLAKVLNPLFPSDLSNLRDALSAWDIEVRDYKKRAGRDLPEEPEEVKFRCYFTKRLRKSKHIFFCLRAKMPNMNIYFSFGAVPMERRASKRTTAAGSSSEQVVGAVTVDGWILSLDRSQHMATEVLADSGAK
eukprot:6490736-Amphidinium_carterae.1